jgi:hypothetical protein
MPCFHTHWLVALAASVEAPPYVQAGRELYLKRTDAYRNLCLAALRAGDLQAEVDGDGHPTRKTNFVAAMDKAHTWWAGRVRGDPTAEDNDQNAVDAMTCFSAYMLGACGPDFWMVPSEPKVAALKPSFGEIHFDLGHYNRAHRQFELSIAKVGGPKHVGLQSLVQRSYFLGMATHIAADLIIHQLVNVTAGAYNLLEKTWNNEHGGDWGLHIWNTHNKVEHFWDSYIRYRYLGDYGPFWPHGDTEACDSRDWFTPVGFPTVDGLLNCVDDQVPEKSRNGVREYLRQEATRFAIEKPIMFPWLFCDRVLSGEIDPFIYATVVDKKTGAYPTELASASENALSGELRTKALGEAVHGQMQWKTGYGEHRKLEHFSSKRNLGIDTTSFNYLTFKVCPDVERTKSCTKPFVGNSFYDYRGLHAFYRTAVRGAAKFVKELSSAYENGRPGDRDKLRLFWNLDTGLGLRVRQMPSETSRETITNLEFVHVFQELDTGNPHYRRRQPYLFGKNAHADYPGPSPQVRAFETYAADAPFPNVESIYEPHHDQYLEQLKVNQHDGIGSNAQIVHTSSLKQQNTLVMSRTQHRLNLCFRAAIADLMYPGADGGKSYPEALALFFQSDKPGEIASASSEETKTWLAEQSKSLDYRETPEELKNGLQIFATRILVNTKDETADAAKAAKREIANLTWNNVIPYSEHRGHYGRNFAIGTGRKSVLHPIQASAGFLNPALDLTYYKNISPTEHVFFTLHPLVRKGAGYWDVFSKENIAGDKLNELKQISSCGTVKIVLIYERTCDKSLNLREAYIDGLQVPVET